jgi:DNA-directed RNA polymerase specialized sigma24 family protein
VAQRDLRRVQTKARAVKRAEQELHEAILAAVESGESYRDIAPYAGLSSSRVYQIVQEAKRDTQ